MLAVAFIQLRFFEDPVYSFNNLMQWLFLGTILSLDSFHRYLTTGRAGWLALSIFLYLLTALTYEITYLFWILHAGLFLTTPGRWSRAAAIAPFASIAVLLMLGGIWLHPVTNTPQQYGMNLDVQVVTVTTLKQLSGAWPLSYPILFHQSTVPVLGDVISWKTLGAHPAVLAFGFAAAALLMAGVVKRGAGESPLWGRLLLLGFLLAVLPAPLIGVARKYQVVLIYGMAYLPVYIEYFGVASVVHLRLRLSRRAGAAGRSEGQGASRAASLFCAAVAVFHCEANNRVVAMLASPTCTQGARSRKCSTAAVSFKGFRRERLSWLTPSRGTLAAAGRFLLVTIQKNPLK